MERKQYKRKLTEESLQRKNSKSNNYFFQKYKPQSTKIDTDRSCSYEQHFSKPTQSSIQHRIINKQHLSKNHGNSYENSLMTGFDSDYSRKIHRDKNMNRNYQEFFFQRNKFIIFDHGQFQKSDHNQILSNADVNKASSTLSYKQTIKTKNIIEIKRKLQNRNKLESQMKFTTTEGCDSINIIHQDNINIVHQDNAKAHSEMVYQENAKAHSERKINTSSQSRELQQNTKQKELQQNTKSDQLALLQNTKHNSFKQNNCKSDDPKLLLQNLSEMPNLQGDSLNEKEKKQNMVEHEKQINQQSIHLKHKQQLQNQFQFLKLFNPIELLYTQNIDYIFNKYQKKITQNKEQQVLHSDKENLEYLQNVQSKQIPTVIQKSNQNPKINKSEKTQQNQNVEKRDISFRKKDKKYIKNNHPSKNKSIAKVNPYYQAELFQRITSNNCKSEKIKDSQALQEEHTKTNQILFKSLLAQSYKIIKIESQKHTALFPNQLNIPLHLIKSGSLTDENMNKDTTYSPAFTNPQLIQLLNFVLTCCPDILTNLIEPTSCSSSHFCMWLFNSCKYSAITVDGCLPFDQHYYALYGEVKQYIWFNILIKCLAVLYHDYQAIQTIHFMKIYQHLTGRNISILSKHTLRNNIQNYHQFHCFFQNIKSEGSLFGLLYHGKLYQIIKIFQKQEKPEDTCNQKKQKELELNKKRSINTSTNTYNCLNTFIRGQKLKIIKKQSCSNIFLKVRGTDNNTKILLYESILSNHEYKLFKMPKSQCNYIHTRQFIKQTTFILKITQKCTPLAIWLSLLKCTYTISIVSLSNHSIIIEKVCKDLENVEVTLSLDNFAFKIKDIVSDIQNNDLMPYVLTAMSDDLVELLEDS